MSSRHRLTRSFRTLSGLLYLLNLAVAVKFALKPHYLDILVGALTGLACLVMFCVAVEMPTMVITKLESSKLGENLFTFRGRYIVDLLIALFLFAMGVWGILMAVATLILIFGIRFVGVKQPDAFNEIFRHSEHDTSEASYTLDTETGS
mmetsp:Transcript_14769/g.21709  ORF Transcript_14769/g.21709 Transcript_14769/m.21709 type:complete len:149 (-) Transcript_14769:246-692(-)